MVILGLGLEICKFGASRMPESKGVLKQNKRHHNEETQVPTEGAPNGQNWSALGNKIK